jgi:hypothetical protein
MSRLKPRPTRSCDPHDRGIQFSGFSLADHLGGLKRKRARGFACPFLFVERLDLWSLQAANCCDE